MMLYNSTISTSKKIANASADVAKYDRLEKLKGGRTNEKYRTGVGVLRVL
jgi:hypothetical protein